MVTPFVAAEHRWIMPPGRCSCGLDINDGLVNKHEAADLVGVSSRTLERWVTDGRLERYATGKHGAAFYLISAVRHAERSARRAPRTRTLRRQPK